MTAIAQMTQFNKITDNLQKTPKVWCVTGVAGFIGSNLLEYLLKNDQIVSGIDNYATGNINNLNEVRSIVGEKKWRNFSLINGDIRDYNACERAMVGVDYVLHQAALGSVPRSIEDPITTNSVNINGFLNVLHSAKEARVSSFTYAASSSTYGDHPALPKIEENIGKPLSPYAVTKLVNELYAEIYTKTYNFPSTGLRYFNVFGLRQDPKGAYAAVIPKWIRAMIDGKAIQINGDGETSRDFCFVDNVIQMNILAATDTLNTNHNVYNVALGDRTTLNELYQILVNEFESNGVQVTMAPEYRSFRKGDVRHSQASIAKAQMRLGYQPEVLIRDGIAKVIPWYLEHYNIETGKNN